MFAESLGLNPDKTLSREALTRPHRRARLLNIPDKFKVIAVVPLRVPDETPAPKERKSLDAIVSWEKYGSKSP
jgi:hypothetical protein